MIGLYQLHSLLGVRDRLRKTRKTLKNEYFPSGLLLVNVCLLESPKRFYKSSGLLDSYGLSLPRSIP